MNLVGLNLLYQANFRPSWAGLLSDVYYTVYNADGTIYLSRRQTGVVEYAGGSYGVKLTFPSAGSWSIHWDIDGITNAKAGEEINIYDDQVTYTMIPV